MSEKSRSLIVIPARMAAVRLPGKPLALLRGKPMIVRVWEKAMEAGIAPVLVAAGDQEIVDVIKAQGGEAVLTDPALPSGTDRVWAGVQQFDSAGQYDIIVNLQGDMPVFKPQIITTVLETFSLDPSYDMATPVTPMQPGAHVHTPDVVKVAVAWDKSHTNLGRALYFSRAAIPHDATEYEHHVGIYAYRRAALQRYVSLPQTNLERWERLEQLRALEDGMKIAIRRFDDDIVPVDQQRDLDILEKRLAQLEA